VRITEMSKYKKSTKTKTGNRMEVCMGKTRRKTTKQIGEMFRKKAENQKYLWQSAYVAVAYICERYPRRQSQKILEKLARKHKAMASSSVFTRAANLLKKYHP